MRNAMTKSQSVQSSITVVVAGAFSMLIVSGPVTPAAQQPQAVTPAPIQFEVVSIKPNSPASSSLGGVPMAVQTMSVRGGRFHAFAVTPGRLISRALGVNESTIVDGPDWIRTARYNIDATTDQRVADSVLSAQLPQLIKTVLEDRFRLKYHVEDRRFRVYALVMERKDGRYGPRLRPSVGNCIAPPQGLSAPTVSGSGGKSADSQCFSGTFRAGTIRSPRITMAELADWFTRLSVTDRLVVDRTDLPDAFDVDLQWAPEPTARLGDARPLTADSDSSSDLPSLFTAIREQLGLRLESRQEPLQVIVVDHLERPTPN
jgi:uncharacterized protein (TIGR03435 family)